MFRLSLLLVVGALSLLLASSQASAARYGGNKQRVMVNAAFLRWHATFKGGDGTVAGALASYGGDEHALTHAAMNFAASSLRVREKNALSQKLNKTNAAVFGLNAMSDLSPEEFRAKYLMPARKARTTKEEDQQQRQRVGVLAPKPEAVKAVPNYKDWKALGAVTAVKNQEQCGSCWAFSATEEIESQWILAGKATNTTIDLAPQQIVDCDDTSMGCGGGETGSAYNYVINAGGLEPEKDYPYKAQNGACDAKKSEFAAHIASWKMATSDYDEKTLQANLLSWGPISICVDASSWQDYQSGVMTWEQCAWINILDHCVQLTGYNLNNGNPYWMVRNSWGTSWGSNPGFPGYIFLEMWEDTCGLAHDATSVTI